MGIHAGSFQVRQALACKSGFNLFQAEIRHVCVFTMQQGERDPYGIPPPGPARDVVTVQGDHGLKTDLEGVSAAVRAWLPGVVAGALRLSSLPGSRTRA